MDSSIDELNAAIKSNLLVSIISSLGSETRANDANDSCAESPVSVSVVTSIKEKDVVPNIPAESKEKGLEAETKPTYDRWNLLDDAVVDYGNFGKKTVNQFSVDGGFYITTAINYTNGPAHMGHAYEATTSDAIARYFRVRNGEERVFFLTGADEHGQKIANTAEMEGKIPIEICDKVCFSSISPTTVGFNDSS
jgi:hypothetical protein